MVPDGQNTPLRIESGAHSVAGKVRDHNEDSSCAVDELGLYAVADGLGGHQAGERASELAVEVLARTVRAAGEQGEEPSLELLLEGFSLANAAIIDEAALNPERAGMGTTLTALLLSGGRLLIGHVGDCRAWRVRDGNVEQLTRDHTLVAQEVQDGVLAEEDVEHHPMRHVLSRCLGMDVDLEIDLLEADLSADDVYVLASDGMIPATSEDDLAAVTLASPDPAAAAEALVVRACERDGSDNITAVVVACREPV